MSIASTVTRILMENEDGPKFTPYHAYLHARNKIGGRCPECELSIVNDPYWAYHYAKDIIKGRWPEAESTIAREPYWSYRYAVFILDRRWPEAEEAIASSAVKDDYLKSFPEARDDWVLKGWLDWLDT